jgi:hypothetical protein
MDQWLSVNWSKIRQVLASLLNGMAACIDLHLDFSSEKSTDVKKPQGLRLEV